MGNTQRHWKKVYKVRKKREIDFKGYILDVVHGTDLRWREMEASKKRQDALLHATIDDMVQMREQVCDVVSMRHVLQRQLDRSLTELQQV